MNKEIEAFPVIWYRCPECDYENTVPIQDNPYLQKGFACKGCKSIWTTNALFEAYDIFPSKDKMDMLCTEFICECGYSNVIFTPVTEGTDKLLDEDCENGMRMHMEGGVPPTFGLCEECGTGYDLVYPLSESAERWLREKGLMD